MAILSSDGTYVTVEKGDTLSEIAQEYAGGVSKTNQLAAINNLSDPDKIIVGQKIKLTENGNYQTPPEASCITTKWSGNYSPQAKLTVACDKQDANTMTLWYQLEYVAHGYAASTTAWFEHPYTIKIDGKTVKTGGFKINGISSTTVVTSGFTTVSKSSSNRNVPFSIDFAFNITWSGVYSGTRSASGSITCYAIGSGSSGSSSGSSNPSNQVTIKQFGLQSNTENTLFATWTWGKSNTASYKVLWDYATGDGIWFVGENRSNPVDDDNPNAAKQSTYTIPSNATKVRLKVLPVSKTYTKNDKETKYWTAAWSEPKEYNVSDLPPEEPGTPNVTLDKFKLTATLDNLDLNAEGIQFQVVKNNSAKVFNTGKATIVTGHASYSCTVDSGGEYKVRCRSYRGTLYSDWSDYSSNTKTIPNAPGEISVIRATTSTSVYLEWVASDAATGYELEYTTKKNYFDGSDQTTTKNGIEFTHFEVTGLTSGTEYFFRVRATNEQGASSWSEIVSIIIGKAPAAPTTWSSTTTAVIGDELNLYWVHNSEDGSSQTYADLELIVNGVLETHTIQNTSDEEERDKTSVYPIDTSEYVEGTTILWRVRTAGITNTYGDWSVQREIVVYAPATISVNVFDVEGNTLDVIESFPFYIEALAGPREQTPISYHLSITSNTTYETVDNTGNRKVVTQGDAVYSKYFDISEALAVEMSPHNIDLENSVYYTVTCTVAMDSGLTAEASTSFTVNWVDVGHLPNAEIGIDQDTLTAYIRPYCEDIIVAYYEVTRTGKIYTKTVNAVRDVYGAVVPKARTRTGEIVYQGTTSTGVNLYYCEVEERVPVEDVYLSVYRRQYDGSFIEIGTGLDGALSTTVTDPHPALDYARYRIVAATKDTGAISFYDPPGFPVENKTVVIQWDEEWSNYNTTEANALEQPAWSGSVLKLPYNIDVQDKHSPDVELVEYIGRSHPIGYYGTQLGQTSSWAVDIDKKDTETLYALRRLARWMGDVYVREPSGSGYWANIVVNFGQKHRELIIPVTLELTRVEGGV